MLIFPAGPDPFRPYGATMDTLLASQPAAAGVSPMLILAVWTAAIVAAVVATIRRTTAAGELRDQLRELERKLAAPVGANPTRATPSFGAAFYEATPSPLAGLLAWPGAVPTVLAAVLAVGGAGLMLTGSNRHADDRAGDRRQLLGLQASHDSLMVMVQDLRDSLRVLAAAPVPRRQTASSAEPTKPLASALRTNSPRARTIPRATAAPALEAGAGGEIPKAPPLP